MGTITTSMNFLARDALYERERPYLLMYDPPENFPKSNIRLERRKNFTLEDVRGQEYQFQITEDGFQLLALNSKLSREQFDDEALVKKIYLQEVADALRAMFGAHTVQVFEHLIRKRHDTYPISTGEPYEYNQPTSIAHVDTTKEWTAEMVHRLNPITGNKLLQGRVLCVNVWKPLRGPVRDWPLCLCHPKTVDANDLHAGDLVYDDYVVENMQLHHTSRQRWLYLSDQSAEEAWVFVQSDSDAISTPFGVPHSSFALPMGQELALPRESIEVRCLVYM